MVQRHLVLICQMGKEETLFPVEEVLPFLGFLSDRLHKMLLIDIGSFYIFGQWYCVLIASRVLSIPMWPLLS